MRDLLQGNARSAVFILVCLWVVVFLPNLWLREFTGTDEPQYAQIGREVLVDGHWSALRLNGNPYYGEPPLYFWLEAAFSLPRGDVTEATASCPPCLWDWVRCYWCTFWEECSLTTGRACWRP